MKRILILSSADTASSNAINDNFAKLLNKRFGEKFQITVCHFSDIDIFIETGSISAVMHANGRELKDNFDLVYFKSYHRNIEVATSIVNYLEEYKLPFFCSEARTYTSTSKLSQLVILSRHSIPVARTIYISRNHLSSSYNFIAEKLGLPFVMKSIDGKLGLDNHLIKSETKFRSILNKTKEIEYIVQTYIPNKFDFRVLVLNSEIKLVIKRQRTNLALHLNNTSKGSMASEVPISDLGASSQQLALKSATIIGREIAGVDIIFDAENGAQYVLEVNASPQIASGAFADKKIELIGEMFQNMLSYNQKPKGAQHQKLR